MIRKAKEGDIEAVAAIYDKLHTLEEAGKLHTGWIRSIYPTIATARAALERDDLFVYEQEGRILAAARINQEQVPEYTACVWQYDAPDDEIMVLHTLVVDPEEARRGLGKSFVRFYEEYALQNGCPYLRMDTNKTNAPARALYAKLGYSEPGIVSCVFNGIEGVQLVCLEKCLQAPDVHRVL